MENEDKQESLLKQFRKLSRLQREEQLERLEMEMRQAAKDLNFEAAADLRDMIMELKGAYK